MRGVMRGVMLAFLCVGSCLRFCVFKMITDGVIRSAEEKNNPFKYTASNEFSLGGGLADAVERVLFPDFYREFKDEVIEEAFERYDEMNCVGIYFGEQLSIRLRHSYESVRLLLIRNKMRLLDLDVMELCSKHLHQLLFFSMRGGSIEKLTNVVDDATRRALIINAMGIYHLSNQGLSLERILLLDKRLRLKTLSEWKVVCFRLDSDMRNLYPYFATRKEAIEAKRKAPRHLPLSEDPLLI